MNPIYKFTLAADGGDEQQAFPVYRDDLAKDFELQTNEEFYRKKLSGKLTFVKDDYDFIVTQQFDTQFDIKIYISYNAGISWTLYWSGNFWKTDCKFDQDNKNVTVTPEVVDQYTDVLAGLEKEYNLTELAPEIRPINMDKRPMIQVYVPGQTVIGCFLSGMWWEQSCESVTDVQELTDTYFFSRNKSIRIAEISGTMSPVLPKMMTKEDVTTAFYEMSNGKYTLRYDRVLQAGDYVYYYEIVRNTDNLRMWYCVANLEVPPQDVVLSPVAGTGAIGDVSVYIHDMPVYARYVCDVDSALGINTHPIPDNDIVENNRNYQRVVGYNYPNRIWFSERLSVSPTQWGLYQPGQYYDTPDEPSIKKFYPVARNAWGAISIWFAYSNSDWYVESQFRKEYTLRDAYPLASVISVLLKQIAPNLTHFETPDYSQFFYNGNNPLLGINQTILITPKSNVISLGYDQPAQKAPITLKVVLDMLRDCFRCYWFVDEQNRFRIEHVEYFRRGGSYSGTPVVGRDLTVEQVMRNGKKWAFGTSQFQYDKPEMASRYQFGWMDDVTQLFDGNPIDIVSKYVNPENIEQIDVSQFTSDIDYILLNPNEISKDGFVLLAATGSDIQNVLQLNLNYSYSEIDGSFNPSDGEIALQTIRISDVRNLSLSQNNIGYYFYDCVVFDEGSNYLGTVNLTDEQKYSFSPVSILTTYPTAKWFGLNIYDGATHTELTMADVSDIVVTQTLRPQSYQLPYYNFVIDSVDYVLQNAYVAFVYLQQYYFWDMPAWKFRYNGNQLVAHGVKKLKTQTLKFPSLTDPNTLQLIKTDLGFGTIQKLSLNLSSRNANTTLKYDTE